MIRLLIIYVFISCNLSFSIDFITFSIKNKYGTLHLSNVSYHDMEDVYEGINIVDTDIEINNIKLTVLKNKRIFIDKNKEIIWCFIKYPISYKGLLLKENNIVSFYSNGTIKNATLSTNSTIYGISFPPNSQINYQENGSIYEIYFDGYVSVIINSNALKLSTYCRFDGNGIPYASILFESFVSRKIQFEKNKEIIFYQNGEVSYGVISKNIFYNFWYYPKNTGLYFDMNGKVIRAIKPSK